MPTVFGVATKGKRQTRQFSSSGIAAALTGRVKNYLQKCNRTWRAFAAGICILLILGAATHSTASENVSLAWDASPDADIAGYRLYYGNASGDYSDVIDVENTTVASVSNLKAGSTYFFAVTAYNTAGLESLLSNEVSLQTPPAVPPKVKGRFSGANFQNVPGSTGLNASLELLVSKGGLFSGRIMVGGSITTVRGKLSPDGTATVLFRSQPSWTLALQVGLDGNSISAVFGDGLSVATISLTTATFSRANAALQAGTYTITLGSPFSAGGEPSPASGDLPDASGFANLVIGKNGSVRLAGQLADAQAFSAVSTLKADGHFTLHTLLYHAAKGFLAGDISVHDTPGISDGDGQLLWLKPPQAKAPFYRDGFEGMVSAQLSRFLKASPAQGAQARIATPLAAILSSGDLSAVLTCPLSTPTVMSGKLLSTGDERLRISINPTSGRITGSLLHPADGKPHAIRGVIFQKRGAGAGYFRGLKTTGRFDLLPLTQPN